jgi:hypothetical protein
MIRPHWWRCRANPTLLHGPHQADQITSRWLAMEVVACPALIEGTHPLRPAGDREAVRIGPDRLAADDPVILVAAVGHDRRDEARATVRGATSTIAWKLPSLRPQSVTFHRSSAGYSVRMLQPLSGSTMIFPPSPPAGEPIAP